MILCPSCLHPRVEREQSKRSVFYFFGIALLVSVCYKVVGLKPRPMEKIACASLIQEEKSDSVASLYHRDDDANSMASLAKYIFGVSTGHAGSTTAHEVLGRTCGNASIAKHFEMKLRFENDEKFGSSFEDPCVLVRTKLLPAIFQERGAAASFVDLGHFHNRGPVSPHQQMILCLRRRTAKKTHCLMCNAEGCGMLGQRTWFSCRFHQFTSQSVRYCR